MMRVYYPTELLKAQKEGTTPDGRGAGPGRGCGDATRLRKGEKPRSGSIMQDGDGTWYHYSKKHGWVPLKNIEGFKPEKRE